MLGCISLGQVIVQEGTFLGLTGSIQLTGQNADYAVRLVGLQQQVGEDNIMVHPLRQQLQDRVPVAIRTAQIVLTQLFVHGETAQPVIVIAIGAVIILPQSLFQLHGTDSLQFLLRLGIIALHPQSFRPVDIDFILQVGTAQTGQQFFLLTYII